MFLPDRDVHRDVRQLRLDIGDEPTHRRRADLRAELLHQPLPHRLAVWRCLRGTSSATSASNQPRAVGFHGPNAGDSRSDLPRRRRRRSDRLAHRAPSHTMPVGQRADACALPVLLADTFVRLHPSTPSTAPPVVILGRFTHRRAQVGGWGRLSPRILLGPNQSVIPSGTGTGGSNASPPSAVHSLLVWRWRPNLRRSCGGHAACRRGRSGRPPTRRYGGHHRPTGERSRLPASGLTEVTGDTPAKLAEVSLGRRKTGRTQLYRPRRLARPAMRCKLPSTGGGFASPPCIAPDCERSGPSILPLRLAARDALLSGVRCDSRDSPAGALPSATTPGAIPWHRLTSSTPG